MAHTGGGLVARAPVRVYSTTAMTLHYELCKV
jgi:hypothetical protein